MVAVGESTKKRYLPEDGEGGEVFFAAILPSANALSSINIGLLVM